MLQTMRAHGLEAMATVDRHPAHTTWHLQHMIIR
jgi:hypothetical protein